MMVIHVGASYCHYLAPSKGASLEQCGQQMGTLIGTRLSMCMKPQQTAEMNTPHFPIILSHYCIDFFFQIVLGIKFDNPLPA